jgi:hypothetical protein
MMSCLVGFGAALADGCGDGAESKKACSVVQIRNDKEFKLKMNRLTEKKHTHIPTEADFEDGGGATAGTVWLEVAPVKVLEPWNAVTKGSSKLALLLLGTACGFGSSSNDSKLFSGARKIVEGIREEIAIIITLHLPAGVVFLGAGGV